MVIERTPENKSQNKNSLILYLDQLVILDELSNEEAGILFKAIAHYVHTGEDSDMDKFTKLAYLPIKIQLKKDLEKWRKECIDRSVAGRLGGIKTQQKLKVTKEKQANQASARIAKANQATLKQVQANQAVNVYVNENENENVFKEIINYLNNVCGTNFKHSSKQTQSLIKARMNEGFTVEDFKTVIYKKYFEWSCSDMSKHLIPQTLFGNKFEGYLNQVINKTLTKGEKNARVSDDIIGSFGKINEADGNFMLTI
jgi:uncharacterized phage protein (TIGR02220 family)